MECPRIGGDFNQTIPDSRSCSKILSAICDTPCRSSILWRHLRCIQIALDRCECRSASGICE